MPWKTTKLKFCGVAVRRRTLYILTLLSAISAVPAVSWAVLVPNSTLSITQKLAFFALALATIYCAASGCWTIIRTNSILYREEARLIWPGAALVLLVAIWLGYRVTLSLIEPDKYDFVLTYVLGGVLMFYLLSRCLLLKRHPRRADVQHARASRRDSHGPMRKSSPTPEIASAVELEDEDNLDGEAAGEDDSSSDTVQ